MVVEIEMLAEVEVALVEVVVGVEVDVVVEVGVYSPRMREQRWVAFWPVSRVNCSGW